MGSSNDHVVLMSEPVQSGPPPSMIITVVAATGSFGDTKVPPMINSL